MRPGEPQVVPEEVDEQPASGKFLLDVLAVDLDRDRERRGGCRCQR
jgi:hypothetical protein